MNFNFTDVVRRAIEDAKKVAIGLGCDEVGAEHVLWVLLESDDEDIAALLAKFGLTARDLRDRYKERIGGVGDAAPADRSNDSRQMRELRVSSRLKRALESAMAVSRKLGDDHVGALHLFAALAVTDRGRLFENPGLDETSLMLAWPKSTARDAFRIRIDDSSERSIYEQIVSRVTEAIATGELPAGRRLPTVRRLADESDVAPGTVARAYGELERQGIIITRGSKGTFVADPKVTVIPAMDRPGTLTGLLRPTAVAAFHLGATAGELRAALEEAMRGIFDDPSARS